MRKPDLFMAGQHLVLGKRIGKGGEGEVYLLEAPDKKAVKVYTGPRNIDRENKVALMVQRGIASASLLVAFPENIVIDRQRRVAGFSMRLVEGFREIHNLYGPKSRKQCFPKADFRFLVRVAANAARAVAQVHATSCVIGDLNESGLLVSQDAMVALIDADSFQLTVEGQVYPCLVGKPDFTAPELHGKSLAGIVRTKEHDHFALGVVIFQLLFMGRHPYAGHRKGSDLSLDQMIAANLFAYSKRRQTGVTPPGMLPSLDDFPAAMADGFERAFGLDPSRRPGAVEWVGLLQGLEAGLSRCSSNKMHYYPTVARNCPWCRMEAATGAVLFLLPFLVVPPIGTGVGAFDVEKIVAALKSYVFPDPSRVMPKMPAFNVDPSSTARSAKAGGLKHKLMGLGLTAVGLVGWIFLSPAWFLWVVFLIAAWVQFGKDPFDASEWKTRYQEVDARLDEAVSAWRNGIGFGGLVRLRTDIESAINEYRGLSSEKSQALSLLQSDRRARQLNDYLDKFPIKRATIKGIGDAKKVTLASFGVETAADITRGAIEAIPGFGTVTAGKLLSWRSQHERRFVYNQTPDHADVTARAKVESEFSARALTLAQKISGGQAELLQGTSNLRLRLQTEDRRVTRIAEERAQLEVDLAYLGIDKPPKAGVNVTTPSYPPPPAPSAGSGGVLCPRCGSRMVRRTARKGHRAGNQFWGCSRYPNCKGTRQ